MELENKILVMSNDKKYIILELVNFDDRQYAYLINRENESDSIFREIKLENNKIVLSRIDYALFATKIYPIFLENLR